MANSATIRTACRFIKDYNPAIFAILEPMASEHKRVGIGLKLGFHSSFSNAGEGGKIWVYFSNSILVFVINMSNQIISIDVCQADQTPISRLSMVYAKCSRYSRRLLWDNIIALAAGTNGPWVVDGDFNAVLDRSERLGSRNHDLANSSEFRNAVDSAGLLDAGFAGNKFT
ncbi:uncharacterized protein LOC131247009 [Magnolia sinica]|uniref:uncharacterized protein LOC131247009 n=1 Tax=Magnolia sinica TaxID=86752 RepID=UPI002659B8B1|nr:uncharacterized protein LOC131247009 [Magnolia sinica]